jgi:hypothetical protein
LKIKQLVTCFTLVSSSTMKMEAVCTSGTSAGFQYTKESYIPENRTLHKGHCVAVDASILRTDAGSRCRVELRDGEPAFDSRQRQDIFFYSPSFRPTQGLTQPCIQWIPGYVSLGIKQQRREADHSSPYSSQVKNGGAVPPLPHMFLCHSA